MDEIESRLRSLGYTERPKQRPTDDTVLESPEGVTGHHIFWSSNQDGWDNNTWFFGVDFMHAVNLPDKNDMDEVRKLYEALGVPKP